MKAKNGRQAICSGKTSHSGQNTAMAARCTPKPTYLPKRFKISVGGFLDGSSYEIVYAGEVLALYRRIIQQEPQPLNPSPEAWQKFWGKLDQLGVWKWQKSYWNRDVLDGTQWEVDIRIGERWIKCDGSNSFPEEDGSPSNDPSYTKTFNEFVKAVSELCGIELGIESDEEKNEPACEWQYHVCPRCGCRKAVEILYGMPTVEAFKQSEEGKFALGGCCQEEDDPDRRCPDCKYEWNSTGTSSP